VFFFALVAIASAQDYAEAAVDFMDLGFDIVEVERKLAVPPTAAPVPASVPRAALPLTPNSTLDRVTVFLDHALVTRTRTLEVARGPHTVRFEGLPLAMQIDGIDARIVGGEGRVITVEIVSGHGDVESTREIQQIRERARELTRELGEVKDAVEGLLAQRAYLRRAVLPSQASAQPRLGDLRSMINYVGEAEARLASALRAEEDAAERLGEELSPLLVRLEDPVATGRTVRVVVEGDAKGPLTVALRYRVTGASWTPAYDARLVDDEVVLEQYGVVTQHTGEDWTDAELALSTAAVSPAGQRPPLVPWDLGGPNVAGQVAGGTGVFTDVGIDASGSLAPGLIESDLQAEVRGNGALVFGIDGRRTVAGDGSPQRVPVATQRLGTRTSFATAPRQALEVHRLVTVGYDGGFPLLPGPVATFVGPDYVGRGAIPSVVPGEALTLSFGPHDGFRVTRQLVERERSGGSRVRYRLGFLIRVRNSTDAPARVEIVDQIPVTRVGRIDVKVQETSGGIVDEATGRVVWTPTIAPGAEHTVQLAFEIVAPRDESPGLDREIMYMH